MPLSLFQLGKQTESWLCSNFISIIIIIIIIFALLQSAETLGASGSLGKAFTVWHPLQETERCPRKKAAQQCKPCLFAKCGSLQDRHTFRSQKTKQEAERLSCSRDTLATKNPLQFTPLQLKRPQCLPPPMMPPQSNSRFELAKRITRVCTECPPNQLLHPPPQALPPPLPSL